MNEYEIVLEDRIHSLYIKISDLQQENKQLKERYERLKQEHIDTITRNEEKQQRIDKAIEYIKEHLFEDDNGCGCWWYSFEYYQDAKKELLEILGDKENE